MGRMKGFWILAAIGGALLASPVHAMPYLDGSEAGMQNILNSLEGFEGVNASRDVMLGTSPTSILADGVTMTIVAERAGFMDRNTFGVYSGNRRVELFDGKARVDDRITVNLGALRSDLGSPTFGFYLHSPQGWFTSDPGANPDNIDHMVTYRGTRDFLIGFEDLLGGGDRDFDDFVIRVSGGSTTAAPVPEPGTLLLIGSGMLGLAFARKVRR